MAYRLGIVGHEGKKFTQETEGTARQIIREQLRLVGADCCVSGGCWTVKYASKIGKQWETIEI